MIMDKSKNKIIDSLEEFIYKNLLTQMTYYVELNMSMRTVRLTFEYIITSIIPVNKLNVILEKNDCKVKPATEYNWSKLIWYKNCPLLFKSLHVINTSKDCRIGNRDDYFDTIRIYTLHNKKCKECLIDFIHKSKSVNAMKIYNKTKNCVFSYRKRDGFNQLADGSVVKRTFDDLFMINQQKAMLVNHLDGFVNKREWYRENHIPYHFGILLYGVPGSGKTVVAQAIASHISAQFISITGEELSLLNHITSEMSHWRDCRHPIVLLIDDIDVSTIIKNRQSSSSRQEISLLNVDDEASGFGNVLNILDGIDAMENIIYVFTTNHLEDIDPALIRPGRIDITMEIGYVCKETLNQFFNKHFNDDLPEDLIIRDGLTFAKLQTLVMTDISKEDFIEYVKEKE